MLGDPRIAFCDLMIGRQLRIRAERYLREALLANVEGCFPTHADDLLDRAAHCEWIAARAERGEINWGGRFNRCGYHAHFIDERTAAMTWAEVALKPGP